jgi:hypothetical protein
MRASWNAPQGPNGGDVDIEQWLTSRLAGEECGVGLSPRQLDSGVLK